MKKVKKITITYEDDSDISFDVTTPVNVTIQRGATSKVINGGVVVKEPNGVEVLTIIAAQQPILSEIIKELDPFVKTIIN